ncbi:enoyl-CoA hydratase/isomerase family protein [Actinoplanes bogorensis]|uniref:Enoyl-CoA hydratase/isomerase family protein n=1 Tax=Paractinoplanes bogorensis TaxID=1610840 RepID=A0ABS5YPK2_9ACTN|nr:enoyl-CoA hydratase-related protein [Actinoplanes bogorensis]MBU2663930.1 enoyl-CoA hydratase/isomerase family protein [Actinoplanes bogorensis]
MTEVELKVEQGVATITLSAPRRRNALTVDMARQLIDAAHTAGHDPSVGAVVVCGQGSHFCAGAHRDVLAAAEKDPVGAGPYEDLGTLYESFATVGKLGVPVIAAVRGSAVGAGVNLLLAADVRIVARDARILAGFTAIGLHPGGGHLLLAATAMGRQGAAALALLGQEMDGEAAYRAGLAWECVDDDQVDARAFEIAESAGRDPELTRRITASFRRTVPPSPNDWEVALEAERASQLWSLRRRGEKS